MSPIQPLVPLPPDPPAVTIHSVVHARFALASVHPVTLVSAPAAAVFAGAAWWRALVAACRTQHPDVLDCGDAPGRALEALCLGCSRVILQACPAWPSVAERFASAGMHLLSARPPCLDLADPAATRRIDAWLRVG